MVTSHARRPCARTRIVRAGVREGSGPGLDGARASARSTVAPVDCIRCGGCGSPLRPEDVRCPWCRSRDRAITVSDSISMTSALKLKARHGELGAVAPHLEVTIKREYARDRGRCEIVQRRFDRDLGIYVEEYRDEETNALTFRKAVPLTDQSAHGHRGSWG